MDLSINGRAYDGIECNITMLGTRAAGVAAASYGFSRPHTNNGAMGSDEPYNYSMGRKEYEPGSLSLFMEEVAAIEDAQGGNKDITKIKPFKTYFTYLNDSGKIIVDEVTWKFANWGRDVSVDSDGSAREFEMHTIGIKPNIGV